MNWIHVVKGRAAEGGIADRAAKLWSVRYKNIHGGGSCASKNYIGMYGMQAA